MLVSFCGVSAGKNILPKPPLFIRLAGRVGFITGEKEKGWSLSGCGCVGGKMFYANVQQVFEEFFFFCPDFVFALG